MNSTSFLFVLYWFAPFPKFGLLPFKILDECLSIITNFLALTDFWNGLDWPIHWEKERMLPLDQAFFTCFLFLFFSWVLFLNYSLERRSPHLRICLNVFELIVFIRHFLDRCILYVFVIYKNVFIVTVIEGLFYATMKESQWGDCYMDRKIFDFFFKNGQLFYVIFKSYLSLLKSPKFMALDV